MIYTGTYKGIEEVTTILNRNLYNKDSELLANFSDWLECNYGEKYILKDLVKHGIGIHNGQLHRSLSQIQIKLFEEQNGLDYLVSTSSIIEGVNIKQRVSFYGQIRTGLIRLIILPFATSLDAQAECFVIL